MKRLVIETFDEVGMAATLDRHFGHRSGSDRETARKKVCKWEDLPKTTILNWFDKCRLIQPVVDHDSMDPAVVDEETLSHFLAGCAVDSTMDPMDDFDVLYMMISS